MLGPIAPQLFFRTSHDQPVNQFSIDEARIYKVTVNLITLTIKVKKIMWIHESFANYSETLFVDYNFGREAGNEYDSGSRKGIKNDRPIFVSYGVNAEGSGDMYSNGGAMLHSLRNSLGDLLFKSILTGLNRTFYHQTVTSAQIENYFSKKAGFDLKMYLSNI